MKYALIGCGRIAVNHIKAALNNKLQIVAVCDVIADKMEALLAKYDLQNDKSIKHYTDYKQMLAENLDIELISIATENVAYNQPTQPGFYIGPDLKKGIFRGFDFDHSK